MKKTISTIIIVLLVIGIGKYWMSAPYQLTKEEQNKLEEIEEGLLIKDFYVLLQENVKDKMTYQDISLTPLEDFECKEEKKKYVCTKEDTNITIEKAKSYLDKVKEIDKTISLEGIKNDIDLFGAIKTSSNHNRIIRSIKDQKRDYSLRKFAIQNIPVTHSLDLISGDIEGYISHPDSNTRIIYLTQKEKTYKITLKDLSYFTKEKIQKILNTIDIAE